MIFPFHKNELKLAYIKGLKSNKISFIKKALSVKTDLKLNDLKNIAFLENKLAEIIICREREGFIKSELRKLEITPADFDPFDENNKKDLLSRMNIIDQRTKNKFKSLNLFSRKVQNVNVKKMKNVALFGMVAVICLTSTLLKNVNRAIVDSLA